MTSTQQQTHDTFTIWEDDKHPERYRRWTEALERNNKGLCKVGIEVWKGSGGYTAIGELATATAKGEPVEAPGDEAHVDAPKVAADAYKICERHHRSHAYERYRIQLYYVKKKGGEPHRGDAVAIRFKDGDADPGTPVMDISQFAMQALVAENKSLRAHNDLLLGRQVEMAQANTANMMTGIRMVQVATLERESAADHYASLKNRASPADWNYRVDSVMNGLVNTATRIAPYLPVMGFGQGPGLNFSSPNGDGAPPSGGGGGGAAASAKQQRYRDWFDKIDHARRDKLRDGLPDGAFAAVFEVLHGDAENFANEANGLRALLMANQGLLMQVFTPDELRELQTIANS